MFLCDDEHARMPEGSADGAAMLKPLEAKVVRTRGTDYSTEYAGIW